ncbi:MAG: AAA family ATPase, partial [Romboutsia sp.]|uniref:AAA family ATPase n=1 Tax=Romboutsia sp. TaxID=1965302 RepID=UPI003F343E7B
FSKSIALSYSIFDEFFNPNKEKQENNEKNIEDDFNRNENVLNSEFNYIYCGMRNGDGILSTEDLQEKLNKSLESIIDKNREDKWKKIILELFESNYSHFIDEVFENRNIEKLSSGQSILVVSFTEVIANIENESLILFDEPETHLHPNAISNLMRMINKLLNEFNSYCIMTTHSPMIIQEIPSKYVRVIERNNDMAFIKRLSIESFGENITNIINDVFRVSNSESNYKFILEDIYNSSLCIEDVEVKFDNNLSFNALTFLNILDSLRKDV